jgi:tRNA modification GTPase
MPAIGIAGAPNAGKSSLLNALLGRERSIVSHEPMTTRDVLTGLLTVGRSQCVLFDCAGLVPVGRAPSLATQSQIDELAQQAAIEALQSCQAVLFCVDATKADWQDEMAIRALIRAENVIYVATKSDLLGEEPSARTQMLARAFSADFLLTSASTRQGLPDLVHAIERMIQGQSASTIGSPSAVALTARHRQMVTDAIDNIGQALAQTQSGHDEVAAMMIRAGYQALAQIEQQHIDEEILDRIFSRFCIGK